MEPLLVDIFKSRCLQAHTMTKTRIALEETHMNYNLCYLFLFHGNLI